VRVRIGGEQYAFGVHEVLGVADVADVAPVPGAAAGVLGVSKVRGQILPVVDLGAILGVPGGRQAGRLVITEQQGGRVGFAVDELQDVCELPVPSEGAESPYLEGAALVDGALIGMVDVAAVLASAATVEGAS
jgi:purine-binding chemotaxis protein CheW